MAPLFRTTVLYMNLSNERFSPAYWNIGTRMDLILVDVLELVPTQFCGTLSEDLNTCSSCRKRLPEDSKVCKYFLKPHEASTFPANKFF
jgi:hypothetical protein